MNNNEKIYKSPNIVNRQTFHPKERKNVAKLSPENVNTKLCRSEFGRVKTLRSHAPRLIMSGD